MTEPDSTTLIAIDWGTTSARAYRMAAGGTVCDMRSAPLGIGSLKDGGFVAALDTLLDDWRDAATPRIACGMIGSRQGWVEAPYVECPTDLASLGHSTYRTEYASCPRSLRPCCKTILSILKDEVTVFVHE